MIKRKRLWLGVWLALGWAIALVLQTGTAAIAQSEETTGILRPPIPATELRGVWLTNIDSEVLFSKANLEQATQRLRRLNFNTMYPTVWNGGYTLYPSATAERVIGQAVDPYPGLQERDMLAEAVELGHAQGLSVIPWFEFGLMAPADSELVRRHPDWITQRRDGSQIVMQGKDPRVWLNPTHPEVRQFLADLVGEVVENYDIDGIQFDDHFGLPVELGYDDYTVELYRQEHQGKEPPEDFQDEEWMSWRASKITSLMLQIFFTVKNQNQDCIVSLSPNPRQFAYDRYLQDWYTWQRLGFLEELIVQVYRTSQERFLYELSQPELQEIRTRIPVAIGILTGLRILPIEMTQIEEQVWTTRDRQFNGMAFFFYETLGDRDEAFQQLFATPATRPTLQASR